MKLRNKKTGQHGEYQVVSAGYLIRVRNLDTNESYQYDCIAGFNDNWEDYEPVEPLIKDEKIRKAVRAWAEANGLDYANIYESSHAWYLRSFNNIEQGIDIYFWGYGLPKELEDCKSYTITELCGDEE